MGKLLFMSNVSKKDRALKRDGAITANNLVPSVFDVFTWNGLRNKTSFPRTE